ncbi:hypothetical protein P2H44_18350 [Albimonas sp. CAU 1670]|uniref:hypothetical protein n=1 Tax=Albimonas sp. CAU 1670 TaxID=3032599 RepID=UPI0023DA5294|nr:hypothetical protein [Albimonas sp. CAU 1670]MDF2234526.1 hypothetical protein [Albimonas sp. CAU 1670]
MTRSADILRRAALPMILLAGLAAAACAPVGPAVPDSVADDGVVLVPAYPDYQKTY